jgi:hypothetical protein
MSLAKFYLLAAILVVAVFGAGCTELKQYQGDVAGQEDGPLPTVDEPLPTEDREVPVDAPPPVDMPAPPVDMPAPTCGAGQTLCGASCVNTVTDRANCGACGRICPSGQSCAAGVCQSGDLREPGRACTRSSDCPGSGGACLPEQNGWPGGFCSYICAQDEDCGAMAVCLGPVSAPSTYFCRRSCLNNGDCRAGYQCNPVPGRSDRYCAPSCVGESSTPGPELCNAMGRECFAICFYQCSAAAPECGRANLRCDTAAMRCVCVNDTACGAEYRCDTTTGRCLRRT